MVKLLENQPHNQTASMWASLHVKPVSFTERALLCDFYLKYLYPSNCVPTKIEVTSVSVLESLKVVELDPLATIEIKSHMRTACKAVRIVGRMAYFSTVVAVASAAGTVVHGSYTIYHLSLYGYARATGKENAQGEQWEKVGAYASAFFVDFGAVVINGISSFFLYGSVVILPRELFKQVLLTTSVLEKVGLVVKAVLGSAIFIGMGAYVSGGLFPAASIPQLVAYDDHRTAMYTVLSLYNQLGLVNQDGGLLPISAADKVTYTSTRDRMRIYYTFDGGSDIYQELIQEGEKDFVIHMRELRTKFPKITFRCNFNGMNALPQKVLEELEASRSQIASNQEDAEWLDTKICMMRVTKRKIDTLRTMHKATVEMSVNGGLVSFFVRAMAKEEDFSWSNQPESYCNGQYLSWHFTNVELKAEVRWTGVFEMIHKLEGVPAVNPGVSQRAAAEDGASDAKRDKATYNQFKYDVGVAKWKLGKKEKPKLYELFGLPENFSKAQLKRMYYFTYNMALHPDKNQGVEAEAKILFQLAQKINEELITDADKREQLKKQ